jgi:hypothetical protein
MVVCNREVNRIHDSAGGKVQASVVGLWTSDNLRTYFGFGPKGQSFLISDVFGSLVQYLSGFYNFNHFSVLWNANKNYLKLESRQDVNG